jgi:hypothetical protein
VPPRKPDLLAARAAEAAEVRTLASATVVASASTSTEAKLKSLDVQDEGMLHQTLAQCVCVQVGVHKPRTSVHRSRALCHNLRACV